MNSHLHSGSEEIWDVAALEYKQEGPNNLTPHEGIDHQLNSMDRDKIHNDVSHEIYDQIRCQHC
jgi:hypothetical protein